VGAGIARALAGDGWEVVVGARSREQVETVADEIGGEWVQIDVADRGSVEQAVAEAGELDLLVANAGVAESRETPSWEIDLSEWWGVYEVNVLGVHLCCRAVIPGMLERGRGRIAITGSGAAYLPGGDRTAYPPSKAAVCRYGEMLANELAGRIPVFFFSPGLVRTDMTEGAFPDNAPWTPPELAPELVRKLASGRYDALAGRYLHAEHDDLDELLERIDEVREHDLNAIRLRR
jgi:3-oxoacyl-[acyl-carrier protein] reductase